MRRSVVLFLDILGYTELAQASNPEALNHLWTALREAGAVLTGEMTSHIWPPPYSIRVFTDNIVIGWPIPEHPLHGDGESQLGNTFLNVAQYQLDMAVRGYFVRGGIAVGDVFIDDTTVFGPALIDAYRIESDIAVHPRVVLSEEATQMAQEHTKYYGPPASAPQNNELLIDVDGRCFVNYLAAYTGCFDDPTEGRAELRKKMRCHKREIVSRLEKYEKHRRVWDKYAWAARYHNHVASKLFSTDGKLAIEDALLRPPFHPLLSEA